MVLGGVGGAENQLLTTVNEILKLSLNEGQDQQITGN